jgi:hypothetical protein
LLDYKAHESRREGRFEATTFTVNGVELVAEVDGYLLPRLFELRCAGDDDAPTVTARFWVNKDGRVEVRKLTVVSQGDGREVRRHDLLDVRLGDLLEKAVEMVSAPSLTEVRKRTGADASMDAVVAESERMTAANHRGGVKAINRRRLRVTPMQLRRVAEIVRTCDDGRPVDAVSDALDVGIRAAQLWIKRARDNVDPGTGRTYLEGADA